MELAGGEGLFDRFVYPERGDGAWQERMAALLEDVCTGITGRAAALRGKTRRIEGEWLDRFPLLLVVVDELSSLTGYVSDPALRRRIDNAVSFVLSQGRSVGVVLIGLTQDVRVQTLGMRDLFPTRVALRHRAPDLILGEGARAEGAATDRIARRMPGVAYVRLEDEALPVRVRFAHVTDTDIARLVRTYGQPPAVHPVPAGLGG
jgi:S-DNA-T family DNA segregation ATPase FtsK/SpoIIIE